MIELYDLFTEKVTDPIVRKVKKGEVIYHEGDNPKNIYFLKEGLIGLFYISESGKESFLRIFSPKNVFGHRSFFADEPYHASSIALRNSEIYVIPQDSCNKLCLNEPHFLKLMAKGLAQDLRRAEHRMSDLSDKSVNVRIGEALIYLKNKYSNQVWTRKEIAEYTGSTPETVTRVMTSLEDAGLIEKKGRDFNILDEDKILDSLENIKT